MNAAFRMTSELFPARRSDVRALSSVRSQTAFVRALLDEIERGVPHATKLDEQLVEELARLGCKLLDAANALRDNLPDTDDAPAPETERCA